MMKIKLVFILLVASSVIFAQLRPNDYKLGNERLSKVAAATPASNSITDIMIVDGVIWLGTSRGLSKSTNDGEDWTNYYQTPEFGNEGIIALGLNSGVIWATTGHSTEVSGESLSEGSGIRYSTDNGNTWEVIDQPVDDPGDSLITYGINTIRALPVTVEINNISYDIAFTENTVWITSFAGGLRKSTDMGRTWQRVVLPPDNLNRIKPTDTLNFSLQPVAGNFGPESHLNHRVFSVVGVDDSTLYVGTAGGINKSTDNGKSWTKFSYQNQSQPISGNFVTALAHDKSNGAVWAATWKAEDLAENWGVSVTTNGGETWEVSLPGERAHNFGFKYLGDVNNPSNSHVFAPTDNGIFRTSNRGNSWVAPPSIRDDETNVPISTTVFYSMNSKRLEDNSTDIWIGSANGLAKLNEAFGFWNGTWTVYRASASIGERVTYAYPNPFNPNLSTSTCTILFMANKTEEKCTVRIFDFGMNLVKTVVQNVVKNADALNRIFVEWDGTNEDGKVVVNGVYFYRVDNDSDEPLYGKIMVLK